MFPPGLYSLGLISWKYVRCYQRPFLLFWGWLCDFFFLPLSSFVLFIMFIDLHRSNHLCISMKKPSWSRWQMIFLKYTCIHFSRILLRISHLSLLEMLVYSFFFYLYLVFIIMILEWNWEFSLYWASTIKDLRKVGFYSVLCRVYVSIHAHICIHLLHRLMDGKS